MSWTQLQQLNEWNMVKYDKCMQYADSLKHLQCRNSPASSEPSCPAALKNWTPSWPESTRPLPGSIDEQNTRIAWNKPKQAFLGLEIQNWCLRNIWLHMLRNTLRPQYASKWKNGINQSKRTLNLSENSPGLDLGRSIWKWFHWGVNKIRKSANAPYRVLAAWRSAVLPGNVMKDPKSRFFRGPELVISCLFFRILCFFWRLRLFSLFFGTLY